MAPATRFTTLPALAAYLGVTRETVRAWIRRGLLVASQFSTAHYTDTRVRDGRKLRWRVYEPDLMAFLERTRSGNTGARIKPPASLWYRSPYGR